jgi:hypothetical protein
MVRALRRSMAELQRPHHDRHRASAQRGSLLDRDRRGNRRQLRAGLAICKTTCRARLHWIEDRARLLVRVLVCPIYDRRRVFSVRNKSLAAHPHQHGPPFSRLRDQWHRPGRVATPRTVAAVSDRRFALRSAVIHQAGGSIACAIHRCSRGQSAGRCVNQLHLRSGIWRSRYWRRGFGWSR